MTRINSDLDPKTLKRMHLVAELREITMVPAALRRSLRTRAPEAIIKGIPKQFLHRRFDRLALEMERRGYHPDWSRNEAFNGFDSTWYGDWESTPEADAIVTERINFRISQKPHLYKD
jgi:hypothetical protein